MEKNERARQINESECLRNFIINYSRYNNKSMYPEKIFNSTLDEHAIFFVPYTAESEYQLLFRTQDKYKPLGVATINHTSHVKNHDKIRELENDGYIFFKIDKLTISTYISIKNLNPIFHKNHVTKPMLMIKILQLINKNSDNFKERGCKIVCVKSPCSCKNNDLVTRYVCYNLVESS